MPPIDDLTLAYLAGAIDSDGWITVKRSFARGKDTHRGWQPSYSERVGLRQVTPEIVDLLHDSFGGLRRIDDASAKRGRPLYSWQVSHRLAAVCIEAVLPFLRVKRAQAENCLALRRSNDLPRSEQREPAAEPTRMRSKWGGTCLRVSFVVRADVLAERERIYLRAKELNRVGIREEVA